MNIELLEKVKQTILGDPERFDMDAYAQGGECGTVCCIAGHAISIADRPLFLSLLAKLDSVDSDWADVAGAQIGLSYPQSDALFLDVYWPRPFRDEFHEAQEASDRAAMAQIAARRIDHFIATEGRE